MQTLTVKEQKFFFETIKLVFRSSAKFPSFFDIYYILFVFLFQTFIQFDDDKLDSILILWNDVLYEINVETCENIFNNSVLKRIL